MSEDIQELQEPVKIIDGLYLGDKSAAKNQEALQRLGITFVVNVTEPKSSGGCHNYFEGQGLFKYHRIPIQDSDGSSLKDWFENAFTFIDEARASGYAVLVHCQQGVSRSPSVVIGYLVNRMNHTLAEAYGLVKKARPEAKPKPNFLRDLIHLEKSGNSGHDTASNKRKAEEDVRPATAESDSKRQKTDEISENSIATPGADEKHSSNQLPAPAEAVKVKGPSPPPAPAANAAKVYGALPPPKKSYGVALPPKRTPSAVS